MAATEYAERVHTEVVERVRELSDWGGPVPDEDDQIEVCAHYAGTNPIPIEALPALGHELHLHEPCERITVTWEDGSGTQIADIDFAIAGATTEWCTLGEAEVVRTIGALADADRIARTLMGVYGDLTIDERSGEPVQAQEERAAREAQAIGRVCAAHTIEEYIDAHRHTIMEQAQDLREYIPVGFRATVTLGRDCVEGVVLTRASKHDRKDTRT